MLNSMVVKVVTLFKQVIAQGKLPFVPALPVVRVTVIGLTVGQETWVSARVHHKEKKVKTAIWDFFMGNR